MMPLYPKIFWLKYPKAGELNALVQIGVLTLGASTNGTPGAAGEIKWMNFGEATDIYIPRIQWASASTLSMQRLNRLQNKIELLFAEVNSGAARVVLTDTDPCWVDVQDDLTFFNKKEHFIWTSESSGFRQAYLYDYSGRRLNQITSGEWEISAITGFDEANGWVYFTGKKDSPLEENVYRATTDGKKLERISQRAGWHSSNFSPDLKYVLVGAI
jgi:dipeptidyl-peptidase-4